MRAGHHTVKCQNRPDEEVCLRVPGDPRPFWRAASVFVHLFYPPAALGAAGTTGSCTRPPLAPGARRRPDGQPYGCFWGPAQAAGPQRARGKNGHGLAPQSVEKQFAASISCISARCTPSGLVDS